MVSRAFESKYKCINEITNNIAPSLSMKEIRKLVYMAYISLSRQAKRKYKSCNLSKLEMLVEENETC
jgi:hypothetical protein